MSDLKTLLRALETEGEDSSSCIPTLETTLSLSLFQIFWDPSLTEDSSLKTLLHCSVSRQKNDYKCINPYHWSRLYDPSTPCILDNLSFITSDSQSYLYKSIYSYYYNGSSYSDSRIWCKLAYWEENRRVGPMFSVSEKTMNIFSTLSKGSGLLLSSLFSQNPNPSQSTIETRKKIGQGVLLTIEDDGVWIYNRTSVPLFLNSPTLDIPYSSGSLNTHKLLPRHSILIYEMQKSRYFDTLMKSSSNLPFDPHSLQISFAKGWGKNYKRQNVSNCPCWLEVLLIVE